jgi:purine nucleosidase
MVVHTDPGVDDALALMYLARQPVRLLGVGSVHGNLPADRAADNALRVLELLDLPHVPVAIGATSPRNGHAPDPELSGQLVHGPDGLGGRAGDAPRGKPVDETAAHQVVRLSRQRPGEVTVVELGPLTNLAEALDLEPGLPDLLRRVVWAGGAFAVDGMLTPFADPNAYHDPEAAEHVLAAGFPLTIVPIDASGSAWADSTWLDAVAASDTPLARQATEWMGHYVQSCTAERGERGCALDDVVTAAIATDPGLATVTEQLDVVCELTGHCRGRLLVDRRPGKFGVTLPPRTRPSQVVMKARTAVVLNQLLHTITGSTSGYPEAGA